MVIPLKRGSDVIVISLSEPLVRDDDNHHHSERGYAGGHVNCWLRDITNDGGPLSRISKIFQLATRQVAEISLVTASDGGDTHEQRYQALPLSMLIAAQQLGSRFRPVRGRFELVEIFVGKEGAGDKLFLLGCQDRMC